MQALVTGGAQRVGRQISLSLAALGYDLVIHYHNSYNEAILLQKEIQAMGVKCYIFKADLFVTKEIEALFAYAVSQLASLSLIVNNASIFEKISFYDTDMEIFDRNFNIHLKAPFILTRSLALMDKKAQVINIIDTGIQGYNPDYFAYLLSKKSLLDLTKMTARVLGPKLRVNAIAPGSVLDPIDALGSNYMNNRANEIPLKLKGSVDYIIQGIRYLLQNEFVTGECLFIDGGAHLLAD